MKPLAGEGVMENGVEGDEEEENGAEESGGEEEEERPLLERPQLALEWLAGLNALRVARQYYDVTLVAIGGHEVVAHRCVLAAAVPTLLTLPIADRYRVQATATALSRIVDLLYTGTLQWADPKQLYLTAWRLRIEPARSACASRLPCDICSRRLPDLPARTRTRIDKWLSSAFPRLLTGASLDRLPSLCIELTKSVHHNGHTLAQHVLHYVRTLLDQHKMQLSFVCARRHVVDYDEKGDLHQVDGNVGEKKDEEEAAVGQSNNDDKLIELGKREPTPHWQVLAVETLAEGAAAMLLEAGVDLLKATVTWRERPPSTPPEPVPVTVPRLARMTRARSALGLAAAGGTLLAAGGYDRAAVMAHVERYCPMENRWTAAPSLPGPRARFALVRRGNELLAIGGSDGQRDLATVTALVDDPAERWSTRAPLGTARCQSAAAVGGGALWTVGGAQDGVATRSVLRMGEDGEWREGPALNAARAEAGAAWWGGALWAVGGRDNWSCLSSVERMGHDSDRWDFAPELPGGVRRSCAVVVFGGSLLVLGGADGGASVRRCEVACETSSGNIQWRTGPSLMVPRAAAAAAVLDDVLYVVGGYSGKEFLSCMECLSSLDGAWTCLLLPRGPHACPPLPEAAADESQ